MTMKAACNIIPNCPWVEWSLFLCEVLEAVVCDELLVLVWVIAC